MTTALITPAQTAKDLKLYTALCKQLEKATKVDEIKKIHDLGRQMAAALRVAKNREPLANYLVLVKRAERKLGETMKMARAAGELAPGAGRPRKNGSVAEPLRATLAEINVNKKLSARARREAALSPSAFDKEVKDLHEEIINGTEKSNRGLGIGSSRVHSLDSLDFFPTPPWATRTLMEVVLPHYGIDPRRDIKQVWEPGNGEGHMSDVLKEYVAKVVTSDIHNYGEQDFIHDFLNGTPRDADWIVTNPPFRGRDSDRAMEFALRALDTVRHGVALLVRTQWATETKERYERLLRDRPPTILAFFTERIGFHPERWDPDGVTLNTGISWCVWLKDESGLIVPTRPPLWIPPGQKEALTRADDRERFAAWSMDEAAE
jgi:hypothetical protein